MELLERLDRELGVTIFRDLRREVVESAKAPVLRDTYATLGIEVRGGKVRLTDRAPKAGLRRAMTARIKSEPEASTGASERTRWETPAQP